MSSRIWHHRIIAGLLVPNVNNYYQKSAYGQTSVNEAMIACALERYRRANGQFPGTLAALTPQYLAAIPHDVITGEPLKYELTGPNQFKLYSVGWNEIDDNGKTAFNSSGHSRDLSRGDWAWEPYQ